MFAIDGDGGVGLGTTANGFKLNVEGSVFIGALVIQSTVMVQVSQTKIVFGLRMVLIPSSTLKTQLTSRSEWVSVVEFTLSTYRWYAQTSLFVGNALYLKDKRT